METAYLNRFDFAAANAPALAHKLGLDTHLDKSHTPAETTKQGKKDDVMDDCKYVGGCVCVYVMGVYFQQCGCAYVCICVYVCVCICVSIMCMCMQVLLRHDEYSYCAASPQEGGC